MWRDNLLYYLERENLVYLSSRLTSGGTSHICNNFWPPGGDLQTLTSSKDSIARTRLNWIRPPKGLPNPATADPVSPIEAERATDFSNCTAAPVKFQPAV